MPYKLPPVTELPTLTQNEQIELLNNLFEPHPAVTNYLSPILFQTPNYSSYDEFIEKARIALLRLDKHAAHTLEIISSHPRLGIPKVKLSEHSNSEQKNLQTDSPEIIAKFVELNKIYEETYPGLRFVLFVNGRSRPEVIKFFNDRISRNDYDLEVLDALNAMCDIALDRIRKLQSEETKL